MRARIALLILGSLALAELGAQSPPNPFEEEAPETLLDLELGDADVSFFGSGTWTAGIAPAIGWTVTEDDDGEIVFTPGYSFPGLENQAFSNRVDLTLSLWLLERYFFETTVSDDPTASTFLLGYAGFPDESVQSVLVGNAAIGISAYPYLGFGDERGLIGQDAPGASALFQTPWSEHELMVRFAPAQEEEIVYANGGIVDEERLRAVQYQRDRHFVLPDGNLDLLEVYVEDADGEFEDASGNAYRRVDLDLETVYSLADGTLSFASPPTTRVLVYYESNGVPIGHDDLGTGAYFGLTGAGHPFRDERRDFSYTEDPQEYLELFGLSPADISPATPEEYFAEHFTATIDGKQAFLLHEPGRYAPFASASYYGREMDERTSLSLETRSGGSFPSAVRLVRLETRDLLRLAGADPDPRAFQNRYPLASSLVGDPEVRASLAGLYGPAGASLPSAPDIVLRDARPAERIALPADYIPGSVRIQRNGVVESDFVVNDSGEIDFRRPLAATDVVRVSYRSSLPGEAAELLFASGNRFYPTPGVDAELALGGRWKPVEGRYSTRPGQYPGHLTLSGSVALDTAEIGGELRGAVSFSSSDTSGALRFAGMGENSRTIPVSATALFPAPPSSVDPGDPSESGPVQDVEPEDLGADLRGRLFYVDHYAIGPLGDRQLLAYNVEPSFVTAYPYESGGRIGPYPASLPSDDGESFPTAAVFDYEIPAGRRWVAGLIRVDGGRGTDLSETRTLIVPYRVLGPGASDSDAPIGSVEVFIQVGAIGEDLDTDGSLEGGSGISFSDVAAGLTLTAGTVPPPGVRYTEDADGNGVLDREIPDLVVSRHLVTVDGGPTTGWDAARIRLTAEEAARLSETRAVRVLIAHDGTTSDSRAGTILVGEITAHGSAFSADYPDSASVSIRELPADLVDGESLEAAFPEVASRLSGAENEPRLLSVDWSGLGTEPLTLVRGAEVPAASYETMRLYYRLAPDASSGGTIALRAVGDAGTIAETGTELKSEAWNELVVELPADSGAVIRTVEIVLAGVDSSEVLLDELSFWDPRTNLGAVSELELEWRPEVELSAGNATIVSDVALGQRLRAQTSAFPGGISAARSGVESSTDLSANVLGADVGLGLDLLATDGGTGVQGRHEVRIPIAPLALVLGDRFRAGYGLIDPGFTHTSDAALTIGTLGEAALGWTSTQRERGAVHWSAEASAGAGATTEADGLSAELRVSLREEVEEGVSPSPYLRSWAESFADVAPRSEVDLRSGRLTLAATLTGDPIGLEGNVDSGFAVSREAGQRSADLSYSLGVPLRLREDTTVTLSLGRSGRVVEPASPRSGVAPEIGAVTALHAAHPVSVAMWPFWELADPDYPGRAASLTSGLVSARYRPEIALSVQRAIRSSPWSLLVPATTRLTLARPTERDRDAAHSEYAIVTEAFFVAPNLFGRLGTTPLFPFYDSDEYQTSARVEVSGGDDAPWETQIGVDAEARLIWGSGHSLRVENTLTTAFPSEDETTVTSTVAYLSERPVQALSWLPLPPLLGEAEQTFTLESSLEFEYDAASERALGRLRHAATIHFEERGSIRLHGGVGLGVRGSAQSRETLLGLQLGIEGELRL